MRDPGFLESEAQGSTIVFSGDFQSGAILNIDSALTNVKQTVNALPSSSPDLVKEIEQLVSQLHKTLQQPPPDKEEEAEAVAQATEIFVNAATKEKPNKFTVKITKEGLQKAAQNIASVMPKVMTIVPKIIELVQRLQG